MSIFALGNGAAASAIISVLLFTSATNLANAVPSRILISSAASAVDKLSEVMSSPTIVTLLHSLFTALSSMLRMCATRYTQSKACLMSGHSGAVTAGRGQSSGSEFGFACRLSDSLAVNLLQTLYQPVDRIF